MQIEAVTIITDVSDPFGLPTSRRERVSLSRFFHQTNPNCLIFLSCCGNFLRPDETWQVVPLGSWTPVRWVNTSVLPDTHLGTSPRLKRNSRLYWTNFGIQMPDCISSSNKSKITEFLPPKIMSRKLVCYVLCILRGSQMVFLNIVFKIKSLLQKRTLLSIFIVEFLTLHLVLNNQSLCAGNSQRKQIKVYLDLRVESNKLQTTWNTGWFF